jgi:hypothetical protein
MKVHHAIIAAVVAASLSLAGCGSGSTTSAKTPPPKGPTVKQEPGGVKSITLQEIEVKRLGIEIAEVSKTDAGITMPYASLLYDPTGKEWAYKSDGGTSFVRTPLKVKTIEGDKVILAEGPPAGTKLVTKGAVQLYGIDFGVGK